MAGPHGPTNPASHGRDPRCDPGIRRLHLPLAHVHRLPDPGGGAYPDASRYAGIPVGFYQALALTLAGGFAGLAGVVEVIGVQHRLLEGITSGYGFTGIVAALFGGVHPLGTIPASWLFGALLVGADKMQRAVQVPSALIDTLLGLVVMFMVGSQMLSRKWARRHQISLEAARKATAPITTGQPTAEVQS